MTKKKDEPKPNPAPEVKPGPVDTTAEVIDNPAQTIIEGIDTGAEIIEADPVEEVIEEHTPPAPAPVRGIDELYSMMESLPDRIAAALRPVTPAPAQPDETQPNPKKGDENAPTPEEPATPKPERKRIKLFRK